METIFALIFIIAGFALMFNVMWIFLEIWFVGWVIIKIAKGIVRLIASIIDYIEERHT